MAMTANTGIDEGVFRRHHTENQPVNGIDEEGLRSIRPPRPYRTPRRRGRDTRHIIERILDPEPVLEETPEEQKTFSEFLKRSSDLKDLDDLQQRQLKDLKKHMLPEYENCIRSCNPNWPNDKDPCYIKPRTKCPCVYPYKEPW